MQNDNEPANIFHNVNFVEMYHFKSIRTWSTRYIHNWIVNTKIPGYNWNFYVTNWICIFSHRGFMLQLRATCDVRYVVKAKSDNRRDMMIIINTYRVHYGIIVKRCYIDAVTAIKFIANFLISNIKLLKAKTIYITRQ